MRWWHIFFQRTNNGSWKYRKVSLKGRCCRCCRPCAVHWRFPPASLEWRRLEQMELLVLERYCSNSSVSAVATLRASSIRAASRLVFDPCTEVACTGQSIDKTADWSLRTGGKGMRLQLIASVVGAKKRWFCFCDNFQRSEGYFFSFCNGKCFSIYSFRRTARSPAFRYWYWRFQVLRKLLPSPFE